MPQRSEATGQGGCPMRGLPEWVSAELERRAEVDRLNRKAACDQWAARYSDSGVRVDSQPGTQE